MRWKKAAPNKRERYSVRDNGAVLRHHREGKRKRSNDNEWTFGKENKSTPYLHIAGVQVHRIVATAFHGPPERHDYVVDHIDTNARNNRPENLRWLTRLENVLKNPVTRRRVEYYCGSIEAFLDNPSLLRNAVGNPNFSWMRSVSLDEARNCKARMSVWVDAGRDLRHQSHTAPVRPSPMGQVHSPLQKWEAGLSGEPGLDFAQTFRSAQYMWSSEIQFPRCPSEPGPEPLREYLDSLTPGIVLAECDDPTICPELRVHEAIYLEAKPAVLVLCRSVSGGATIVGIQLSSRMDHFIHFKLGTYSDVDEASQAFRSKMNSNFWPDAYKNAYK